MKLTTAIVSRALLLGRVAVLCAWLATPAWALGPAAPPQVTFVSVWVDQFSTTGFSPCLDCLGQLFANVGVRIPGGTVPLNVASVKVVIPTGQTFDVPLDRVDWAAEESFFIDLTEFGVTGAPTGTYTFTVTDTAGGQTVKTDDLKAPKGLPFATSLAVSGSLAVPTADGEAGTFARLLDLTTNPTPTLTWVPAPGAQRQQIRVREIGRDRDNFSRSFLDGTTNSVKVPGGVFVQGRRYQVTIDSFDHPNGFGCSTPNCVDTDMNERARARIEVITEGPTLFLGTAGSASPGGTLNVNATVYNTGPATTVNVLGWIGLPTGAVLNIFTSSGIVIPTNLNANFFSGPFFSRTFDGSEPTGIYVVGLRFVDPQTGATVAFASTTFSR